MKKSVILFMILIACISSSNGLKCYDCRTSKDPFCNDPKSEIKEKDCDDYSGSDNLMGVRSVCLKVVYDVHGFEQVTRQCSVAGNTLKPCDSMRSAESCNICETSLCNGSSNLLTNLWLSLIPFVMTLIIKF